MQVWENELDPEATTTAEWAKATIHIRGAESGAESWTAVAGGEHSSLEVFEFEYVPT